MIDKPVWSSKFAPRSKAGAGVYVFEIGSVVNGWRILERKTRGTWRAECTGCGAARIAAGNEINKNKCLPCSRVARSTAGRGKAVGQVRDGWLIVADTGRTLRYRGKPRTIYVARCPHCPNTIEVGSNGLSKMAASCGCRRAADRLAAKRAQKAWWREHGSLRGVEVIPDTPWSADDEAFVRAHPDGAPLEAIAAHFGCSRERIRQIESSALRKIARRPRTADLPALRLHWQHVQQRLGHWSDLAGEMEETG